MATNARVVDDQQARAKEAAARYAAAGKVEVLKDDRMLPAAVRAMLARGRAALAERRRAEAEAAEAKRRAELAAVEAALEPVKLAAVRSCPGLAQLLPFCDWDEPAFAGHDLLVLSRVPVEVKVPGFVAVFGCFERAYAAPPADQLPDHTGAGWGPWSLAHGRWVVARGYAHPDLAPALAEAREIWLADPRAGFDEDIPY